MTTTTQCIADEHAIIDEDGFVNIVIGPNSLVSEAPTWNNLRWGGPFINPFPILIFRQISHSEGFYDQSFAKPLFIGIKP